MSRDPNTHLSLDDIDTWLAGLAEPSVQVHLNYCAECFERVRGQQEIIEQLGALRRFTPAEGFEDRVMAQVAIPDPFAIHALERARRRLLANRRSLALAALLVLTVVGSMAGSVAWSLANPDTLARAGAWLLGEAGQVFWVALRGVVSNVIEQPWYGALRAWAGSPVRVIATSAALSLAYLGGLLALRRLLTAPTPEAANASW